MKRIVIIEGNVTSLSRNGDGGFSARVEGKESDVVLDLSPEAADQIGASFREPMRIVVEIGEADIPLGGLKNATTEDLVHALAAVRTSLDECRRENEALVKSNERLQEDFDATIAKNDELLEKIAAEAIPEGGLSRKEICRELAKAHYIAEEYRREVESLSRRLEFRPEAFDPEKHITKATVVKWLEEDAVASEHEARYASAERADVFQVCAKDTRAIIARINATKDSP